MKDIVVEGPDEAGKSTLCERLSQGLGMPHIRSEGPERYPGEINYRISQLLASDRARGSPVIYDRHPAVSHQIYCEYTGKEPVYSEVLEAFYVVPRIYIYCGTSGGTAVIQSKKEWDTPAFIRILQGNQFAIAEDYRRWARIHADLYYDYTQMTPETLIEQIRRLYA